MPITEKYGIPIKYERSPNLFHIPGPHTTALDADIVFQFFMYLVITLKLVFLVSLRRYIHNVKKSCFLELKGEDGTLIFMAFKS